MIAVLIGGTGLVGSLLSQKLVEDSDISEVISIARRPVGIKSPKLREVLIQDLAELPSLNAELKGDLYFCCLGTTIKAAGTRANFEKIDHDAVVHFAEIAKNHHAKCFSLISASGAKPKSPFFYSRVKAKVEEKLIQMKFTRLVLFKPSLLVGDRKIFRLGERVAILIVKAISLIPYRPLKRRLMTNADDLASKMAVEGKKMSAGLFVFEAKDIATG